MPIIVVGTADEDVVVDAGGDPQPARPWQDPDPPAGPHRDEAVRGPRELVRRVAVGREAVAVGEGEALHDDAAGSGQVVSL